MSTQSKSGGRTRESALRTGRMSAVFALLVLSLVGCGHKQVKFHIPVTSPVDLETLAATTDDDIDPVPQPQLTPLPWPEPARQPPRRRVPPKEDASNPPGNDAGSPPELAIGALTTGGDASPQGQQQARDLIATGERRIAGLTPKIVAAQKAQVHQARYFLDEAKKALNTGDTEGAVNLANKAKLFLDELEGM